MTTAERTAAGGWARQNRPVASLLLVALVTGMLVHLATAANAVVDFAFGSPESALQDDLAVEVTLATDLFPDDYGLYFDAIADDGTPAIQPAGNLLFEVTNPSEEDLTFTVPAGTPTARYRVLLCQLFEGECFGGGEVELGGTEFVFFGVRGINASPGTGQAGSQATLTGAGFQATTIFGDETGCGDVELDFDGTSIGTVPLAIETNAFDDDFSIDEDFVVPARPPGTYTITATQGVEDLCPPRSYTTTFTIPALPPPPPPPPPALTVTPDSGLAGSSTTATATFFGDSGECGPVTFRFDGTSVGTRNTSSSGPGFFDTEAALSFTVPDLPPGPYTVTATQSGCGDLDASATFTVTPAELDPILMLDPEEGTIETEVEASGEDFEPGVAVEIRIGTEQIEVATVSAGDVDADGAFTVDFEIPEGVPGGPQEVLACQRCDGADEVFAIAIFDVLPRIFIDRELAARGQVIEVTGDGFPTDQPARFFWDLGVGLETAEGDELGEVRLTMLIFRRDILGERELIAEIIDESLPEDEDAVTATAEFLAVPGTLGPPDFTSRR